MLSLDKARLAALPTALLVITLQSAMVMGQSTSFQGLGHIPGEVPWSVGTGVAGVGPVAIGNAQSQAQPGLLSPFRWVAGSFEILSVVNEMPIAGVTSGISANGDVIVGTGANGAYRWTQGGGIVSLGNLPGGAGGGEAHAISADASVIVGQSHSPAGQQAFRWTQGTGMVGLGDLTGGSFFSMALGASGDGSVIVGRGASDRGYEAFRWTEQTGMVPLWNVTGTGNYNSAEAVSADGSVIVGHFRPESGSYQAFRWTESGGMVPLGDLPGGLGSYAHAVSEDGSIIVGESYANTAFIWNEAHGMRDLHDLLVGVDLTGWQLGSVNGIATSADTVYLVGTGLNPDHEPEAFLATLPKSALMPEPGSLGLLAGAGLFLLRRRRSA